MSESELLANSSRSLYKQWLTQNDFRDRDSQYDMMNFICSILARTSHRLGVIEAGTGTGKTISYCIPAAIAAKRAKKKLIIVTSTVALQHQLLNGELSQLRQLSTTGLNIGVLKGRRRYVCVDRLDRLATKSAANELDLFGSRTPSEVDRRVANSLLGEFNARSWNGNMDDLPIESIPTGLNARITTDAYGCHRNTCEHSRRCPYYQNRDSLADLDVIVVNYSLLLASAEENVDLLPEPSQCIYIFDEAHRLSDIVANNGASQARLSQCVRHITKISDTVNRLAQSIDDPSPLQAFQNGLSSLTPRILNEIEALKTHLARELTQSDEVIVNDEPGGGTTYRFPSGKVPPATINNLEQPLASLATLQVKLQEFGNLIRKKTDEDAGWMPAALSSALSDVLMVEQSGVRDVTETIRDWCRGVRSAARWLTEESKDWVLHTRPIDVGETLQELIWSTAHAVICTSATLVTGEGFKYFAGKTGFPLDQSNSLRLESPFNVADKVALQWADMAGTLPNQKESYLKRTVKVLPELLKEDLSGLVLFTNTKDMEWVYENLPNSFQQDCLLQGNRGVEGLLAEHRRRIDERKRSFLIGTDSLREGVDLANDYLRHVIITRIPFPVPNDPVLLTEKEMVPDANGFMTFDIPIATLKLFQACGRLLRNEEDYGKITFLDRRALEARYAGLLMSPLPNYTQVDLAASD